MSKALKEMKRLAMCISRGAANAGDSKQQCLRRANEGGIVRPGRSCSSHIINALAFILGEMGYL